jgi:hypothetical protein
MRAILKAMHSPDVPDLETFIPDDGPFGFLLQAFIGPSDADGAESFDLTVCTSEWFAFRRVRGQSIVSGYHTLFVDEYDFQALKNFLERSVQRSEGETWGEIAGKLSWLGQWEFAE